MIFYLSLARFHCFACPAWPFASPCWQEAPGNEDRPAEKGRVGCCFSVAPLSGVGVGCGERRGWCKENERFATAALSERFPDVCMCVCVFVLPGRRLGRGCFGMCQVFDRTERSGWQEKGGGNREEGCFSFAVPFRHRAGVIGSGHEWDRLCGRVLLMGRSDA